MKKNIVVTTPHGDWVISVEEKDYDVAIAVIRRNVDVWESEVKALENTSYHVFNEISKTLEKYDIKAECAEVSSIVKINGKSRSSGCCYAIA